MISIIIPVYKVEDYLRECLDSVLAQTYTNFEVICVNDGSPDNCLNILKEYEQKDKRIRVISQANSGISVARNTGLDNAKGEYITFIDSDDKVAPEFLESMVSHMDEADCVEVGIIYFKDESELLQSKTRGVWFDKYLFNKSGIFDIKPSLFKYLYMAVWNRLFKREIIEKYNLRFLENIWMEDNHFSYSYLFHCKKIYEVGKKYYFYRNRDGSVCNVKRPVENYFDELKNYVGIAEHLKKYGLVKKYRRACLYIFIYYCLIENRFICDSEITKQLVYRFANALSFNPEKLLAAVEPKSFGIRIKDISNDVNKLKIIETSEKIKRIYEKNNVLIKSIPQSFRIVFESEKLALIKIIFGVINFQISCKNCETDINICIKEILINGKEVGKNIMLNKNFSASIMVRADANTKTIIDIKV